MVLYFLEATIFVYMLSVIRIRLLVIYLENLLQVIAFFLDLVLYHIKAKNKALFLGLLPRLNIEL